MTFSTGYTTSFQRYLDKNIVVFFAFWVVLFILYFPAAQAGRVGDFPGWVHFLTSSKFIDYVNRTDSGIPSLYQFTQVVSYFFYKLFGANAWAWHLLFITMQAVNALLLSVFFRQLFHDANVRNALPAAVIGALLFCVCPHISEVVVWESAFHYLLALLMMMLVLNCAQQFIITQNRRHAWWAAFTFFLSTYSLELFYLTPFFVGTLCIYYRMNGRSSRVEFVRNVRLLILPQLVCLAAYFLLLRLIYHGGIAHIAKASVQANLSNLSKGPKYVFHLLFFGRFLPQGLRDDIYRFCESAAALWVFYGTIAAILILSAARYSRMASRWKVAVLLFTWVLAALALILPLWFPNTGIDIYDRYTYLLDAFLYMLIALLLANVVKTPVFTLAVLVFGMINIRYTHRVNAYWQQSAHIVNNLVSTFPNDSSKKVLLVDLPECLDGVQMIGTRDDGEFKMMYNAIMSRKLNNEVYDVEAFYLINKTDGAHVNLVNDTTVKVTLNQWGSYWVYYGVGATSYETKDFKVIMRDVGHWYDLILKHPLSDYLILYNVGDQWKKLDTAKKNVDQY